MTVDELITALQKLSAEGHGSVPIATDDEAHLGSQSAVQQARHHGLHGSVVLTDQRHRSGGLG